MTIQGKSPTPTALAAGMALRFTTAMAAAYLGRAHITLRKWRVLGTGPRFRVINNRAYYSQESLEEFLSSHPEYHSTSERSVAMAVA